MPAERHTVIVTRPDGCTRKSAGDRATDDFLRHQPIGTRVDMTSLEIKPAATGGGWEVTFTATPPESDPMTDPTPPRLPGQFVTWHPDADQLMRDATAGRYVEYVSAPLEIFDRGFDSTAHCLQVINDRLELPEGIQIDPRSVVTSLSVPGWRVTFALRATTPETPETTPPAAADSGLHPATGALMQYFTYAHLPPHLADVSKPFADLAHLIAHTLEGPEATVALRKLLESKDCAVRAAVTMHQAAQ